jgi:ATP-dependent helicase/nuclease subunit B
MEPFVAQLTALCQTHPTRAKWVFVPSHAIGWTLGDRLARAGTDWANLRFVTPLDLALRMGAPFLVERGIDPSEDGLGPALIMRLLLELPGDGYFTPLAGQPSMAVALWSTLRELRLAGLTSDDLHGGVFTSPAKYAHVRALVRAYETFLAEHRRGDVATVFAEALLHLDWCPIQPDDCWTELPDVAWPPLHRRLIDRMPGERIVPVSFSLPAIRVPRRLHSAPTARAVPDAGAPPARLAFFHAGGLDAEVEEVFRRILASDRSLDQIEIACGSARYASLIWEKAMRHEWPVTVAHGIPTALTRPGRALLALAEWIEDDFAAGRLRRLLESGDVRLGSAAPGDARRRSSRDPDALTAGQAARLLVNAQAAWGRETYRRSLARLATQFRTRATRDDLVAEERASLEQRARQTDDLAAWIESILRDIPTVSDEGSIELRGLVQCAQAFVRDTTARTSALDALAATSLADALGDLVALGDFRCSLPQALRFLRERADTVIVGADRARPGHLHVSALDTAALSGRPSLFIVGLEEGRVFPAPFEDPILLDGERATLDPALARSTDRTDEAVHAAMIRLASASAIPDVEICLSYSCRDLREYRPTYASWLMLHAYRAASGRPAAEYKDLHEHLGAPKSCVPESATAALDASRWWLYGVAGNSGAARSAVLRHHPDLGAGIAAEAARDSESFTEFDGYVPAAGRLLDPCAGRTVSATELEDAAECPFRHFLKRALRVEAIEAGERDRDVWLDPLLRGSLLHELYAALLRRCRAEGRRADLTLDRGWLIAHGEERLAALAAEMPPPSGEVHDRETTKFLDDLALFVTAEATLDAGRTPVGFEVAFGRADGVDTEPLARPEPVTIDLGHGGTVSLAGRIDRIDRVAPSTYEILDYKTGGYFADDWKGTFAGGRRLQHALYGLAAVELLKRRDPQARVAAAEYYFASSKGQQERKRIPAPPVADVRGVLDDLRTVISSGLFVHAPHHRACQWCHHGAACGRSAVTRAQVKLERDAQLHPFVKLDAHE